MEQHQLGVAWNLHRPKVIENGVIGRAQLEGDGDMLVFFPSRRRNPGRGARACGGERPHHSRQPASNRNRGRLGKMLHHPRHHALEERRQGDVAKQYCQSEHYGQDYRSEP